MDIGLHRHVPVGGLSQVEVRASRMAIIIGRSAEPICVQSLLTAIVVPSPIGTPRAVPLQATLATFFKKEGLNRQFSVCVFRIRNPHVCDFLPFYSRDSFDSWFTIVAFPEKGGIQKSTAAFNRFA
jgi:hypothetical protein